jgi:hypothetical protein
MPFSCNIARILLKLNIQIKQHIVRETIYRSVGMNKEDLLRLIKDINVDEKIKLDDIPEIELYMDQVIQLFEAKLGSVKRKEEDKVLTKTMINNYAKAKLLMSIKNKKYSKEHLLLMSLIYDLKGSLSINDIKLLLNNIVQKYENKEDYDLRSLYEIYLEDNVEDSKTFKLSLENKVEEISKGGHGEFEEKFLLVSSIISMSNMYRRMGELLIDEFFVKGKE